MAHRCFYLLVAVLSVSGCVAEGPYDPDWDPGSPIAGGKPDGLLEELPELAFGDTKTGEVGDERMELFRLELQRTDRIELSMTVTSGDLNPHLSLYQGTHTYVSSESWSRDGDTLSKTYLAESAGIYVLAVRAYQNEGSGSYSLGLRCSGGPCAGELPPPSSNLEADDVVDCITTARRCAFSRLPRYGGAVGAVRSRALMQECLSEATIRDGSSCANACEWVNPREDDDRASELCDAVIVELPFYADATDECLGLLGDCMNDCFSAASGDLVGDRLGYSVEAACWENGFNGSCNTYVKRHVSCGGTEILNDSAGECSEYCMSTEGVHVDDTDGICSYDDLGCEEYCDVDIAAAAGKCGGISADNTRCLANALEDGGGWFCFEQVEERIADMCDLPTVDETDTTVLMETSTERWQKRIGDVSTLTDLERFQVHYAARRLDRAGRVREVEDAFRFADGGVVIMLDATSGTSTYTWVRWHSDSVERGVIFHGTSRDIAAVVAGGGAIDCVPE